MEMKPGDRAKTRGQLLALLCGGDRTAAELAEVIGISRSAIRIHLGGLEEEGLVEYERVVQGVGKPTHRYRLTPAGEGFLSRAYLPLLDGLLGVLATQLDGKAVEELLRAAGRRVAERTPRLSDDATGRAEAAAELIAMLGGIVVTVPSATGLMLRGRCCPVAAIAADHPQVCAAVEELLAAYSGLPVREHCDRAGRPSCRFEISFVQAEEKR